MPACAAAQEDTGPAPDVEEIHHLIERYTKVVDTVDLNRLLGKVKSNCVQSRLFGNFSHSLQTDPLPQGVNRSSTKNLPASRLFG
jgi:hypothetical protein